MYLKLLHVVVPKRYADSEESELGNYPYCELSFKSSKATNCRLTCLTDSEAAFFRISAWKIVRDGVARILPVFIASGQLEYWMFCYIYLHAVSG